MIKHIHSRTILDGVMLGTRQSSSGEHSLTVLADQLDNRQTNLLPMYHQSCKCVKLLDSAKINGRSRSQQLEKTYQQPQLLEVVDKNPRQWLLTNNPPLASLLIETIGDRWIDQLEYLQQLIPIAEDPRFQWRWRQIKRSHKQVLAKDLDRTLGIKVNIDSLFDLQLQPLNGNQRQLLSILHIITLYNQLKHNPQLDILPRTFFFADYPTVAPTSIVTASDELGSADRSTVPPGTVSSEVILTLIQSLGEICAADPDVRDKLQVIYIPESANLTCQMYCAADLTEQIAMASMADVDLHQLKFAIAGVLAIGSLSKANHLLQQSVGADNCFSFGLAIPEIAMFKAYGYDPYNYYKYYPEIRQAIDGLLAGVWTPRTPDLCRSLIDELLDTDEHMVLADYMFYLTCQSTVSQVYCQPSLWTRMSILNVAGVG